MKGRGGGCHTYQALHQTFLHFYTASNRKSAKLGGDLKTSFKAAHVSVVRSHWVAFSWVCVSVWSTKILGVFPVLTRAAKNMKGPKDTYHINDIR